MATKITVSVQINASLENVWERWTSPKDIMLWNNATKDWHTPQATNDLRVGGKFCYRMEARDGSFGFDFAGTYDTIEKEKNISYTLDDARKVVIDFKVLNQRTEISQTFEAESQNPEDMQRQGWQMIMDNFKQYVESTQ